MSFNKDITLDAFGDTIASYRPPPLVVGSHMGRVVAGRYRLVRLLGSGGMGEVYEAEHLTLGVRVAVKTMHGHVAAEPDNIRRFAREAHAVSRLNHPNLVRVLDFGEEQGLFYIAMELLEGRSLGEWVARTQGAPLLSDVADILKQTLDALEVAHAGGIVHRDLKPENIFLVEVSGRRLVKVLDFGLAHVDDPRDSGSQLTKTDSFAGTPEYMSPEQCRSLAVGPSTDIYAVGCVLTTLLQKSPPFSGGAVADVTSMHMFLPVPPLNRPEGAEPVPPLLERLRLDLLSKSPSKRPASVAEVKARLLEAMSPEASAARLPPRKGEAGLGDREDRAPDWGPPAARRGDALTALGVENGSIMPPVGLFRGGRAGGLTQACVTGLAAQGILLDEASKLDELDAASRPVVVLDMGGDIKAACEALERAAAPGRSVLVCVEKPDIDGVNALIAAGAADVLTYPVSPDALAKKLKRLGRRRR
ncbi:MAG TPA: serine/threonine-protein kinase [Polyangiaceae bacterium]|jgi:serine/threonine-protein kinase|nr:serine/threonine-protein kinase [Polyangiaceae bacterium]